MSEPAGERMARLSILLGTRDQVDHHSLAVEIIARARAAGLAGATAFQAERGLGRSGVVHREHLFVEDAPLCVVVVDTEERLIRFAAGLSGFAAQTQMLLTDVVAFWA